MGRLTTTETLTIKSLEASIASSQDERTNEMLREKIQEIKVNARARSKKGLKAKGKFLAPQPKREDFQDEESFLLARKAFLARKALETTTSSTVFHTAERQLQKLADSRKLGESHRRTKHSITDASHIRRELYFSEERYQNALRYPLSCYGISDAKDFYTALLLADEIAGLTDAQLVKSFWIHNACAVQGEKVAAANAKLLQQEIMRRGLDPEAYWDVIPATIVPHPRMEPTMGPQESLEAFITRLREEN
ncbi:MAG: hypothetical protein ACRD4X_14710 [Candidatus Acidiferrales bacterium]